MGWLDAGSATRFRLLLLLESLGELPQKRGHPADVHDSAFPATAIGNWTDSSNIANPAV